MGIPVNPSPKQNSDTISLNHQDGMECPLSWTAIRHAHILIACSLNRTFHEINVYGFPGLGATALSAVVHRMTHFDNSRGTMC